MNRVEVSKLVAVVTATYPAHFKSYTTKDIDNMVSAWERVLSDIPYQQGDAGLTVYLRSDTKGFPPSPGQVLNCIISAAEKDEDRVGELEAWSMVMSALHNSGDINRARTEFNKLPGIVRATVGSPENLKEWALDEAFNAEVVQGIFLRQFANMRQRIMSEKRMYAQTGSARLEVLSDPAAMIAEKRKDIFIGGEWDEKRSAQIEELRRNLEQMRA